jgi:hypothetical protein
MDRIRMGMVPLERDVIGDVMDDDHAVGDVQHDQNQQNQGKD